MIFIRKIKGFTTMELSIVMLLAGLIAAMSYGGYSLVNRQFYTYSKTTSDALALQQLINLLKKDIDKCARLLKNGEQLECISGTSTIYWSFEDPGYILRTQLSITDTFYLELSDHRFLFAGQLVTEQTGTVDEVLFTAEFKKSGIQPGFKKHYANKDLMQFYNHGH